MDEQRETQTFPDARIAAEGFRVIADQLDTCAQFVEFTSPHRIEIMIGESLRPLHDAMNAMVQRFDGMETRFNQRFDALQSTVDTTNATVNSLQAQMNLLDTKILSGWLMRFVQVLRLTICLDNWTLSQVVVLMLDDGNSSKLLGSCFKLFEKDA
ncbi:hypothetical protein ACHAQJ_008151 [Trichoderma viride]